jgi:predicted CXXCH cytochrome family protein
LALAAGAGLALLAPGPAEAQRQFKTKDCLECHQKFAEKTAGLKFQHSSVKQRKCEDCHLRHGVVGRLVLKQPGSALCLTCHK